jgi:hypothetical protein
MWAALLWRRTLLLAAVVSIYSGICGGHVGNKEEENSCKWEKNKGRLDSLVTSVCTHQWTVPPFSVQLQQLDQFTHDNDHHPHSQTSANNIVVITYITDNLLANNNYASYSLRILTAYTRLHHYPLFILSPSSGHEYEHLDQRWNRVKILAEAMDPQTGWLPHTVEYAVWVDADLIFLNFSRSIEEVIQQAHADLSASKYDIIVSGEVHAETGVANTGCFIVRNTDYTRWFLHRWWNDYDHTLHHDQIYFSELYKRLLQQQETYMRADRKLCSHKMYSNDDNGNRDLCVSNHVHILPPNVLNSHPPAYLYQQPHDCVLHLMGEDDSYRSRIFSLGLQSVCEGLELLTSSGACDANDNKNDIGTHFKRQLGLSQEVLLEILLAQYDRKIADTMSTDAGDNGLLDWTTALHNAEQLREICVQLENIIVHQKESDQDAAKWKSLVFIVRERLFEKLMTLLGVSSVVGTHRLIDECVGLLEDHPHDSVSGLPQPSAHTCDEFPDSCVGQQAQAWQLLATVGNDMVDQYSSDEAKQCSIFLVIRHALHTLLAYCQASDTSGKDGQKCSLLVSEMLSMYYSHVAVFLERIAHRQQTDEHSRLVSSSMIETHWRMALQYLQHDAITSHKELATANNYRKVDILFSLGCHYCGHAQHSSGFDRFKELIQLLAIEGVTVAAAEVHLQDMHIVLAWTHFYAANCLVDELVDINPSIAVNSNTDSNTEWSSHLTQTYSHLSNVQLLARHLFGGSMGLSTPNNMNVPHIGTLRDNIDALAARLAQIASLLGVSVTKEQHNPQQQDDAANLQTVLIKRRYKKKKDQNL